MDRFCVDYFHGCYDFRLFCLFAIIDTFLVILMPSKKYGQGEYATHLISQAEDYPWAKHTRNFYSLYFVDVE